MCNTLPAGRYYVGDPCYVLGNDWSNVLESTRFFGMFDNMKDKNYVPTGSANGIFDYKGMKICGSSTAYGDGCYPSNIDFSFPVDAGLLGAVPIELCDISEEDIEVDGLGKVVEFDKPFYIEYDEGTVEIGDVRIHTDYEEETDTCFWCNEEEDYCECGDEYE